MTVIRSAISRTSYSLWLMKMMLWPSAARRAGREDLLGLLGREDGRRLVEDEDPGLAVERLEDLDALLPADRQGADLGVGIDLEAEPGAELAIRLRRSLRSRKIRLAIVSSPSRMFSATVRTGTSMKCWWTMLIPRAIASDGPLIVTGLPSSRISPSSGLASPYRTFIRVVLPAPFSPSRAWISPGRTSR
jgi:hypothetical protein